MRFAHPRLFAPPLASRILRAGAGLLTLSLLAGAAGNVRAERYVAVYFGTSKTENSNLRIQQPSTNTDVTFHGVSWDPKSFESPPYYGYRIGFWSEKSPKWGVEMDMTHYKVYARVDRTVPVTGTVNGVPVTGTDVLGNTVQRFEISHGVNTLSLNLLYRWTGKPTPSFKHGRFQPYVGAGPSYYILHPENRVNGIPNKQRYKPAGIGWQALGGVRYGISHKVTFFAEGKYSNGLGEVETNNGGWGRAHLRTWQGLGGIQYGF